MSIVLKSPDIFHFHSIWSLCANNNEQQKKNDIQYFILQICSIVL